MLDVVFCLKVADKRRVAPAGFVAAVLVAAVDGVRSVVLDVFTDEGLPRWISLSVVAPGPMETCTEKMP